MYNNVNEREKSKTKRRRVVLSFTCSENNLIGAVKIVMEMNVEGVKEGPKREIGGWIRSENKDS